MATVSQLIMQVAYPGLPSNWGVVGAGNWGGVKGIGGVIPVDGGATVCCWASALPVSRANPSAATADNLRMFIVLLPCRRLPCCTLGERQKYLILISLLIETQYIEQRCVSIRRGDFVYSLCRYDQSVPAHLPPRKIIASPST